MSKPKEEEERDIYRITVTFKSGATAQFNAHEFSVKRNVTGSLSEVSWKTPIQEKILYLNCDNVDFIHSEELS
jgi:hypothetical protein